MISIIKKSKQLNEKRRRNIHHLLTLNMGISCRIYGISFLMLKTKQNKKRQQNKTTNQTTNKQKTTTSEFVAEVTFLTSCLAYRKHIFLFSKQLQLLEMCSAFTCMFMVAEPTGSCNGLSVLPPDQERLLSAIQLKGIWLVA